jgi:hypothetical protein
MMQSEKQVEYFSYKKSSADKKKFDLRLLHDDYLCYVPKVVEFAMKCRVLVILNSVKRSQIFFKEVKKYILSHNLQNAVGLLHSKFPTFERHEIESEWISKYGKDSRESDCILIGTQILEQSLDISGEVLFTDLCPMDFLLQRMGRVWRWVVDSEKNIIHHYRSNPEVFIFTPGEFSNREEWKDNIKQMEWGGVIPLVYRDYYLVKTYMVLKGRKTISVPKQVKYLNSKVYDQIDRDTLWMKELYKEMKKDRDAAILEANESITCGNGAFNDYSDDMDSELSVNNEEISDSMEDTFINISDEAESIKHQSPTRRSMYPTKSFSLAKKVERLSDNHFVITFLNGSIRNIDIDRIIANNSKNYALCREIQKDIVSNSLSIALNLFSEKCGILKILKKDYEGTILKDFFGKHSFLLVVDENGRLLDINLNFLGCASIINQELGLVKK